MNRSTMRTVLLAGAALLLCVQVLSAQDFSPPDDLTAFWDRYHAAKLEDDEKKMDELVKKDTQAAIDCLDIMLDELCSKDRAELRGEVRPLAWSLDRVEHGERFIERVRLVLDMDMNQRGSRRRAILEQNQAMEKLAQADEDRSDSGWAEVLTDLARIEQTFRQLGDREQVINLLSQQAAIEHRRGRLWEEAVLLKKLVAEGDQLSYRDELVDLSRLTLQDLIASGIDPDKEKPADLPEGAPVGEAPVPEGGGRTLTSWAPGSAEQEFQLEPVDPKKGLDGFLLPTFHPFEQYQLWPFTQVEGEGPVDFDNVRAVVFEPDSRRWVLGRPGIQKFTLDTDGDGKVDVEFSPSTTPSRVDVPSPDGGDPYPLWVCILSDREKMFGVETNYAPTQGYARLRFCPGRYYEGKGLGTTWKVFDTNMDGILGPAIDNADDLVTDYDPDEHVVWYDTDSAIVGKAKKAVPLSSVMQVGDAWYRTEFEPKSGKVKARELSLATGLVKLDMNLKTTPSHVIVQEVGGKLEGAFFDILPDKRGGTTELPVGSYQIVSGRLTAGKKTSLDQVRMYQGRAQPFTVEKDQTVVVPLGAPFDVTFKTTQVGDQRILDTLTLHVYGRGGEEYAAFFDDPLQLEVEVRDAEGHKIDKGKTRIAGLEEWQNAGSATDKVLWFPTKYPVDNPRKEALEFKVTQKAHNILGGPFESEWIR
ncbi:MAG: hypothetical protein H6825_15175 [Planctomycetes bacterium]|nr:hypothetical protein [Planctomycetota bacterium]